MSSRTKVVAAVCALALSCIIMWIAEIVVFAESIPEPGQSQPEVQDMADLIHEIRRMVNRAKENLDYLQGELGLWREELTAVRHECNYEDKGNLLRALAEETLKVNVCEQRLEEAKRLMLHIEKNYCETFSYSGPQRGETECFLQKR